jgi:uncharacterized protein
MHNRAVLALLAKVPTPGLVKTRLAAVIGPHAAAEVARSMLQDLVDEHANRDYDLIVVCNAGQASQMRAIVGDTLVFQANGAELRGPQSVVLETFKHLLARYERAAVLCADTPFASSQIVQSAMAMLDGAELVIGPGVVGGYYLIAMRRLIDVFSDQRAGRYPYLGLTLTKAEELGVPYCLIEPKWDIDTVEDILSAPWSRPGVDLARTKETLQALGFGV